MQETNQVKVFIDNVSKNQRIGLIMDLDTGKAGIAVGDMEGFHEDSVFNFDREVAAELGAHLLAFASTHEEIKGDGVVH